MVLISFLSRHDDDKGERNPFVGPNSSTEIDAIHARHDPIGDDNRRSFGKKQLHGFRSVRCGQDVIARALQMVGNESARRIVVIYHQRANLILLFHVTSFRDSAVAND